MKTEENKERQRKQRTVGSRGQKAISVRIDNDLLPYLGEKPNKGRFINDLIRREMGRDGQRPPHKESEDEDETL